MDNDRELLDIESIRARHAAATKGPYGWRYPVGGLPDLFSKRDGLFLIMDAVRHGFNDGVLRFATRSDSMGGVMHKATTFFVPPGRGVPDFQEPTNPDMQFLAASWQDVADLLAEVERLRAENAALKSVAQWAQATLTALNGGDVQRESLLHQKLREVMIQYRAALDAAGAEK